MTLHGLEHNAIHNVANGDNQYHNSDRGAHVVQIAPHHQNLAQTQAEVQHFGGDEGAPREGPSLLETGNDERGTSRQEPMPKQMKTTNAEIAPGHAQKLWNLLAAV